MTCVTIICQFIAIKSPSLFAFTVYKSYIIHLSGVDIETLLWLKVQLTWFIIRCLNYGVIFLSCTYTLIVCAKTERIRGVNLPLDRGAGVSNCFPFLSFTLPCHLQLPQSGGYGDNGLHEHQGIQAS